MAAHKSKRINHSKQQQQKKKKRTKQYLQIIMLYVWTLNFVLKKIGKYKNHEHEHEPPTLSEIILK